MADTVPAPRKPGRPKGSRNKRSVQIEERLAAMGCDPLSGMARMANDKTTSPELRFQCYKELLQYVAAKKRVTEHTNVEGEPLQIIVQTGVDRAPG